MTTRPNWKTLKNLKKSDFRYPDYLDHSILSALDHFITAQGIKPYIIDDYRPGDPRQHGRGRAVDTTWPGLDPLKIWNDAKRMQLFSGIGIYLNEKDVVSFHFDTRLDRSVENPAEWGNLIERVADPVTGRLVRLDNYTTAQAVVDIVKKNKTKVLVLSVVMLLAWLVLKKEK